MHHQRIKNVDRNLNTISIYRYDHPRSASDLMTAFHNAVKAGFTNIIIKNRHLTGNVYPNAIIPMATIIDYYQRNGITIEFIDFTGYLYKTRLENPLSVQDIDSSDHIFDRVIVYESLEDINKIVDFFTAETSKKIEAAKGVIDGLTWCLNEVLDNVLQHSQVFHGFVMGQVHSTNNHVSFCIADSGIGIYNSFKNSKYHPRNSVDAITLAIKEGVTRDPSIGQGNGLWGLHQILTNNKGGLVITSQNGSYFLKDARVKTFDKLPFLSKSMGGTIIDFQLDCKKEISISKSLGGHEPVNFRIESMESDSGDIIYKMSEQSSGTGTRKSGERIRNDIINIITETRKTIIMDFSGISVISSSFADELIGKLVVQYGFFGFNQIFRINNMNETVQAILHRSVSQRLGSSK